MSSLISAEAVRAEVGHRMETRLARDIIEPLETRRINRGQLEFCEASGSNPGATADVERAIFHSNEVSGLRETRHVQEVAVKKFRLQEGNDHQRALLRFANELSLLAQLSHDNVVKLRGFVEDFEDGYAWVVLSWEANGNVREFICTVDWEVPERLSLIKDVAQGVQYLHGREPPICHGDLKSLNTLVTSTYRAIITDFGSARELTGTSPTGATRLSSQMFQDPLDQSLVSVDVVVEQLCTSASVLGTSLTLMGPSWTLRWAAPELLNGEPATLASDIWAFAWICWEIITGKIPFQDVGGDAEVTMRVINGDLPSIASDEHLSQIQSLCLLMRECFAIDPSQRPSAWSCNQNLQNMRHIVPSRSQASDARGIYSIRLLKELGWLRLNNGGVSEGVQLFRRLLDEASSTNQEWALGMAFEAKGIVSFYENDYSQAIELLAEARNAFDRAGADRRVAGAVQKIAYIHRDRRQYSEAKKFFNEARNLWNGIGYKERAVFADCQAAIVLCMRGAYEEAEVALIKAQDAFSQLNSRVGIAHTQLGLGHVHRGRSNLSKAEDFYIQSHQVLSRSGDGLSAIAATKGLGHVYRLQRNPDKAEKK